LASTTIVVSRISRDIKEAYHQKEKEKKKKKLGLSYQQVATAGLTTTHDNT
jgi:hypothetical protein